MSTNAAMPASGTIDRLCEVKAEYVDRTLEWYKKRATWPRVVFRVSGATVIALSLGIPFLAAADEPLKRFLPAASYLIAILSAFSSFFGWQALWEKRITTQLLLEARIAAWEADIDAARRIAATGTVAAADRGYDLAFKATQNLIRSTKILTVGETARFFSRLKFPNLSDSSRDKGGAAQPGAADGVRAGDGAPQLI
jgi:hypothetical protein